MILRDTSDMAINCEAIFRGPRRYLREDSKLSSFGHQGDILFLDITFPSSRQAVSAAMM